MTVADKLRVEHRRAPRTPQRSRRRMRRAHDPSRLRGRGLRLRRHPQQQAGDAGSLRRQGQLAAGDEIELARLAPDFEHDGAQRIAGQRVGGGPQRRVHVGRTHGHQQPRIETEFGQPGHRQRAGFHFDKILPHPQQRPPRRHPSCEPGDKTGRGGALPASFREHLVHRAPRETALQRRVRIGMPERRPARRIGVTMRLDALDAPTQTRKRVGACAAHASLPGMVDRHWFSEVNPRPAHLFMMCSNIKLTSPGESIISAVLVFREQSQ